MKTLILQGLQDLAGITGINNHYYFNLNSQAQSKPTRSPQKMRKHLAGVISIFGLRSGRVDDFGCTIEKIVHLKLINPIFRVFQNFDQFFFLASRFWMMVIFPLNVRRQAHQNTFNSSIGF